MFAVGEDERRSQTRLPKINFPPASSKDAWSKLDADLVRALQKELGKSKFDRRLELCGDIIYKICKEQFGTKRDNEKRPIHKNRRQRQMEDIRNKKRHLRKLLKTAPNEEKEGLRKLWEELKVRHSALSKAEYLKTRRQRRKREQERFFREPFQYARNIFDQPRSGVLTADRTSLEDHLRKTYSDTARDVPLEYNDTLVWPDRPGEVFNKKLPTLNEVERVVAKARNKSAPGPNGIPYLLYKRCPKVLKWLHTQLREAWKNGHISKQWMKADGVYIPKEKDSKAINQFRPISLLNVEGKIFFSVMATRLTSFLLANGYVDTSVQKGGVPGIAGCLEHGSMIWEAIQRAKEGKRNLDVIWLDLANAYGSVPHQMIQLSLSMYHVPEEICRMLETYFAGFQMRFSAKEYTTDWINLEVGIAMGCTVSPILFVLAMQVLLKAAENKANPAVLGGGCQMPPLKAFMDDTTILASKEEYTHGVLRHLDRLMEWCRMKFKPKKSRSLSIRKGKVDKDVYFNVGGQRIPTVSEEPVKSLGRWYDDTLKDTAQVKKTLVDAEEGLLKIDRCALPGKYKVWCLHHMLIPMLLWPLLIYEITTSKVEAMEKKVNKFTRKWLGVPPGLSDVALYCRQARLKLPFKSLVEEYKAGKARLQIMLETSEDEIVRSIQPTLRTGRKWKVAQAVEDAKDSLRMKEVIGHTQQGRQGLGSQKMCRWSSLQGKESRDMVIQEVRNSEDEKRYQKAVQQSQQGQWTNWEEALQRSVSWNDVWHMAPLRLSFIIRAAYDLLPSGTNLVKWGKKDDPSCPLCQKRQSLEHVLSSCKVALSDGRYTWRHNRVLEELVLAIFNRLASAKEDTQPPPPPTVFYTEGRKKQWLGQCRDDFTARSGNLLGSAKDWQLAADLPQWRDFPAVVKETGLRPDIVLWSESSRRIVLIELTVPYESRIDQQHVFKTAKYDDLVKELQRKGYHTTLSAVEVSSRGFVAASTFKLLGRLGIIGKKRVFSVKRLSDSAERSSVFIWSKRNETWSSDLSHTAHQ